MAETPEEEQRRRRRKHLVRGLLVGGAAVGLPALLNALVSTRAKKLSGATWAEPKPYRSGDGTITYRELGKGPPLLLLHSFGTGHSSLEWREAAERLAGGHRVIVPDLLGWGGSEKPQRTYDSELYISLVADLLENLVGGRAVVLAAGMSAAYAVQVAVDHPETVRALGLITPLGIEAHGDEPDFKDAMVHRMLRLPVLGTSALNVYTSRSGITNHLRREVYADPGKVDDALVSEYYRLAHQAGAHAALAAYLAGYLNFGAREALGQLDVPVWIGWGRKAVSPPVESADLWLRHKSDAALDIFEDAALMPHAECPADLVDAVERFLTQL